jgi:hypothetical protein
LNYINFKYESLHIIHRYHWIFIYGTAV